MLAEHLPPERIRLWVSDVPTYRFSLADVRRTIREELRANQDRKSFAAASEIMTLDEIGEYLRMGRTAIYERRAARKLAKSQAEKDRAFAPEYGVGSNVKFKRAEIEAWLVTQRQ